ncbi:MAG: queuosine salvage family protein [Pseudomonadales bacterium]
MTTECFIIEQAEKDFDPCLVDISHDAICIFSDFLHKQSNKSVWAEFVNYGSHHLDKRSAIMFGILSVALSYQFWSYDSEGKITHYHHNGEDGSKGMLQALKREWLQHSHPLNLMNAPLDDVWVRSVFGDIPNIDSRVRIITEIICDGYLDGITDYLLERINNSIPYTMDDALKVSTMLPKSYGGDKYFNKAIMLLTVIASTLGSDTLSSSLAPQADDNIARILRAMDILIYQDPISRLVDSRTSIEPNSNHELAIRASSVLACDLIAQKSEVPTDSVDGLLRRCNSFNKEIKHLTATTHY